jgi:hypothetical protein
MLGTGTEIRKSQGVDVADESDLRVGALAALYQAERADISNILGQALVLVSISVAYIGTIIAILVSGNDAFEGGLGMWLPLPVWIAISFNVILNALVFAHNVSAKKLERDLTSIAGYTPEEARIIGVQAGTKVSDLKSQLLSRDRYPLAGATIVSYFGVLAVVLAFTIYCLISTAEHGWGWIGASIIYLAIGLCIGLSWIYVVGIDEMTLTKEEAEP